MQVIYAKESFPTTATKSIFLAGPTPRDKSVPSWRPEALLRLQDLGFDGTVFVPEPRDGAWSPSGYDVQVEWEEKALKRADCIVFWVPRDMKTMPALTTNNEWGVWCDSGKVVFGAPDNAQAVRYQLHYAAKNKVPTSNTLNGTLDDALRMVGAGAPREGGECEVPLHLWRNKSFQGWLQAQKKAGNRLDGCDLLWTFRVGPKKDFLFAWVAHVNVWIGKEQRNKVNEFVFGRTDVSGVVMYHRCPGDLLSSEVVVVKEFRSPARTEDGFIWEMTCGSSQNTEEGTLTVAVHEVEEEAGIKLDPKRLHKVGARQLAGTLSVHQATVYSVELTREEMDEVRRTAGTVRGVEADSERTYAYVMSVGTMLRCGVGDWSTMGMVLTALADADDRDNPPRPAICLGPGFSEPFKG